MKLIVQVSRNEYTEGCDYALVEIDEELAKLIIERRNLLLELKKKDVEDLHIHVLEFIDFLTPITYFGSSRLGVERDLFDEESGDLKDLLTGEQRQELDGSESTEVDDDFELHPADEDRELSLGGEYMFVAENEFGWRARIEYNGEVIETWGLSYDVLKQLI